jgi:hypothetical protein
MGRQRLACLSQFCLCKASYIVISVKKKISTYFAYGLEIPYLSGRHSDLLQRGFADFEATSGESSISFCGQLRQCSNDDFDGV